jgi:VCBS repeat-containing protein
LSLSAVSVVNNIAAGGAYAYAQGGGVFVSGTGTLTIQNCHIDSNQAVASSSGGATNCSGGGLYISGSAAVVLKASSVSGNLAQGGNATSSNPGGAAAGGGLFYYAPTAGSLTIQGCSFDGNSAIGGNGGNVNNAAGYAPGGGIFLYASPSVFILNSSITNNQAIGGNGGPGGDGEAGFGGGVYVSYPGSGLTLINTTVSDNTAQGGNAGTSGAGGYAYGGGLCNPSCPATLLNDTIAFNAAQAGSGGTASVTSIGGGIYGSNNTLTNVILESNSAPVGPDYGGDEFQPGNIDPSSSYDFISNMSGINNIDQVRTLPGMILDNATPQLGALTTDPLTGLSYYAPLDNSQVIAVGTQSVVDAIAAAEGVSSANATDEIGNARVVNNAIDMGAVAFLASAHQPGAADQTLDVLQNTMLNALPGTLLLNDSSPDNRTLTAQDVTQPSHGSVTVNADGSFVYTPPSGFTGTDSFTYDLTDGALTSDPATVTINVKPTNTAPTATDLSYSVDQGDSLDTDVYDGVLTGAADADDDTLFASLFSDPSDGTLTFNLDGSFTYTPNTSFYGTDSFQYEVFDGTTYSSPATVTLTVNQDVPTANPGDYSVLPTGTTSVPAEAGVLAFDPDTGPDLLTATLITSTSYGSLTLNSDGSFSYTPGANFTGNDSFTYESYDGIAYSAPTTVTLTTNPVDMTQTYDTNHDTPLTVDSAEGVLLGAYDAEGDTLTAQLLSDPSHGTVTVNSDGSFTYTPATGYVGTDSFTFTASNGSQTAGTTTATLNVTNNTPLAGDSEYSMLQDQMLAVDAANGVLANAADPDGDSLTAQLVSGPSNGTLTFNSDGSFTYTPNAGFIGTDSFQYDATDGISTSDPAPVTITVNEVIPENQSGSMPSAVAAADFNGDGYADVAMADAGLNTVSVYLNDGSGNLATTPVSTIAVGNAPVALAAGDFGNGQQDLAVVNSDDNTVSILLGNGDGTFTTSQVIGVGTDPAAIAVGNFFGNGPEDLAVVNKGSNTVSILQNNGSGVFSVVATISVGDAPDAVAAGDLNGDGKDDLVVANSADNTISVLLNNGNGTFASAVNYAVGTAPSSVALGDFDGDGNVDVAVADSGSNDVEILPGNGDGTLQAPISYAVGSDPVSVVAGNFAGPGYPATDLAVVNEGSSSVTVLSDNSGSGGENETTLSTAAGPLGMALGNFGNNGQLQGVAVAMAGPANAQLAFVAALPAAAADQHNEASFKIEAGKLIRPKQFLVDQLVEGFNINQKITAAYANLFSVNRQTFFWSGLAAFASSQVGQLIQQNINNVNKQPGRLYNPVLAAVAKLNANTLIGGNQGVYNDIYWQFLAYASGGLKQMQQFALPGFLPMAWNTIDLGQKTKNPNLIWAGNSLVFRQEQQNILQPRVFDNVPEGVGQSLSKTATPLFLLSTSFPDALKAGGIENPNLANFDQRWNMWIMGIYPGVKNPPIGLWKEWQNYVGFWVLANGKWTIGPNALENSMQYFIDTGMNF